MSHINHFQGFSCSEAQKSTSLKSFPPQMCLYWPMGGPGLHCHESKCSVKNLWILCLENLDQILRHGHMSEAEKKSNIYLTVYIPPQLHLEKNAILLERRHRITFQLMQRKHDNHLIPVCGKEAKEAVTLIKNQWTGSHFVIWTPHATFLKLFPAYIFVLFICSLSQGASWIIGYKAIEHCPFQSLDLFFCNSSELFNLLLSSSNVYMLYIIPFKQTEES